MAERKPPRTIAGRAKLMLLEYQRRTGEFNTMQELIETDPMKVPVDKYIGASVRNQHEKVFLQVLEFITHGTLPK